MRLNSWLNSLCARLKQPRRAAGRISGSAPAELSRRPETFEDRTLLSPLTIASDAITSGGFTFTATDSAGTGDDLTVNAGVTVQDTTGPLTLNAGDDFLVDSTSSLIADVGILTINIDFGDADTGVGGVINLQGTLTATAGVFVNGEADDDTFTVSPDDDSPITVNGAGGNDSISIDLSALSDPTYSFDENGTLTVTSSSHATLTVQNVEDFTFTGATIPMLDVTTPDTGGTFTLALDGMGNVDVSEMSAGALFSLNAAAIDGVQINGGTGDDTLIIDFANGSPIPAGGLTFNGGANAGGGDALQITGSGSMFQDVRYRYTSANDGFIDLDVDGLGAGTGESVITYTGLEPISNNGTPTNIIFDLPNVANPDVVLADTGTSADGDMILTGSTFENTTFSVTAATSITINGNMMADNITFQSSDDALGAGDAVSINGVGGADMLNVWATNAGTTTTLSGGANTDTVNLGSAANSLEQLLGAVTVNGDAHDAGTTSLTIKTDTNTLDTGDILNLNDQGDAGAFTYALDATTFSRTGTGTVTYMTVETLNLNTSIGSADVDVTSTAAGINTNITTQDAADDIDVATTGTDSNVIISTAGGVDDVNIVTTGADGGDGGTLGSFTQVNGGDDADTLTLDSSGTASRVELNGEAGADMVTVTATGSASVTNITTAETVRLGNGSLGGLLGDICVMGPGGSGPGPGPGIGLTIKGDTNSVAAGSQLDLDDSLDAGSYTYSLTDTSFTRTGIGNITIGGIAVVSLDTSIGAADVDVATTGQYVHTVITTQDAADDVDVTTTGADSNLIINTAGGADDVNIATTGADGDTDTFGSFTQVNGGSDGDTLTLQGSGAASRVELNGEAGADTINVWNTAALSVTNINGGDGSDTINIGTPANSLGGILGDVCVNGDAHDAGTTSLTIKTDTNTLDTGDILNLNDQGDAGAFTYALDATTFSRTGTGTVTYMTVETLNLNTSIGSADVDVTSTAAGINTNITTQDAADDIDVATTGTDSNVIISTAGGVDDVNIVTTGADGGDGDTLGSFTQVNADLETLDDFEDNGLSEYTEFDGATATSTSAAAAHDGALGLLDGDDSGWLIRTDGQTVAQGDLLSAWINVGSPLDGRAYFAFGGSSGGALSVLLAPDTSEFELQDNSGFSFSTIDQVAQTYVANQWYRVEVDWAVGGNITGRLFDSDGTTLLNTVNGNNTAITSGGIGFRAFGEDKFFDTIQRDTGDDQDTLTLQDSGVVSRVELNAGKGDDMVTVTTTGDMSVTNINTAAGTDTIDINGDGTDSEICVDAGDDNDMVDGTGTTEGITVMGSMGDDVVTGGDGGDNLSGNGGTDTLNGAGGNDVLLGGGGTGDELTGGPGDDFMNGGAGTDIIVEVTDPGMTGGDTTTTLTDTSMTGTNTGNDSITGIEEASLDGGAGMDTITTEDFSGSSTISGSGGSDTLTGGPIVDIIYGEDSMNGAGAGDVINGMGGPDLLYGQFGDDLINGGDGNDTIRGAAGADRLNGDAGDDLILGQGGSGDELRGGAGDDTLRGSNEGVENENDIVVEEADTDFDLAGMDGDGTLNGGIATGLDTLISIELGRLTGGAGGNTINASGFDGFSTLNGAAGSDVIAGSAGGSLIYAGDGDDFVTGSSMFDLIYGEAGNDFVMAGAGNDRVFGGPDSDTVSGQDGDDTLDGGMGSDFLNGSRGADSVLGGDGDDYILGSRGPDRNIILTVVGADNILGTADDRFIVDRGADGIPGTADDTLVDGRGADGMLGTADDPSIAFELESVVFGLLEDGRSGNDFVFAPRMPGPPEVPAELETDPGLIDSLDNDTLEGGSGVDTLSAGIGRDLVNGGADSDLIDTAGGGREPRPDPDPEKDIPEPAGRDRIVVDPSLGAIDVASINEIRKFVDEDGDGVDDNGPNLVPLFDQIFADEWDELELP